MKIELNKRVFICSFTMFFAACINVRDYPINNIPLLYPCFIVCVMIFGVNSLVEGFKRTKLLCLLFIISWLYYNIIILLKGHSYSLENFAYLIEPLLIFGFAGATTTKPGGTKTAMFGLVTAIVVSTSCGLWVYYIGEPIASFSTIIHSSVGGNIFEGHDLRWKDLDSSVSMHYRNRGLATSIFTFSYQLAAAFILVLSGLLYEQKAINKLFLIVLCIMLLIGIITNTERATIVSTSIGYLSVLYIVQISYKLKKYIYIITLLTVVIYISIFFDNLAESGFSIFDRSYQFGEIGLRAYMIIPAISTILHEPFGSGLTSDYYNEAAIKLGWVNPLGVPVSSHNHFVNLIQSNGIVGIIIIVWLFKDLFLKMKLVSRLQNKEGIMLVASCITLIVHSMTHNAGFFRGDFPTQILFALLWAHTVKIKYHRFKPPLSNRIISFNK
jgi:hypothetical protein